MELKMEVYSPFLELLGLLEVHNCVIWESKSFSSGSFSIDALVTQSSRSLLVPNNIVWIEGDTAGLIEYVHQQAEEGGPYITVKGRDLTGILDWYILWGRYDLNGAVPALMRKLVDDCCIHPGAGAGAELRAVPGLALEEPAPAGGPSVRTQKTGGELLEALEGLGEAYGVAFGIRFNPEVPRMEFWARTGVNRSVNQSENEPVFFSTELDDVLSSEYAYDSGNYRNIALVVGEGEGKDRIMVTVQNDPQEQKAADALTWPHRRELYIDARDLQSDSDPDKPLSPEEYAAVLTSRGKEKLAEHQLVRSFSAEVRTRDSTYVYGRDFFLGDTITVSDERLGVSVDAVVQAVLKTAGEGGEALTLTLGYGQPKLGDILKRKAGK